MRTHLLICARRAGRIGAKAAEVEGIALMNLLVHHAIHGHEGKTYKAAGTMVVALIDDFDKLAAMIDSSGMGWAVVVGIVSMYGCSVARTGAPTRVRRAAHSADLFFVLFFVFN